ncbi:50S ribosomal protein L18 [bacterium]|nr:MAG: 50S ribosomal protein L18 [bacterium]
MKNNNKEATRQKRHRRILLKIRGTEMRPRLLIRRSLKHFSAQLMDDQQNKMLFSLSTAGKELKGKFVSSGNIKTAVFFAEAFAKKAKEKGITKIIFDRAGYLYHGRVKAFADALRKNGLEF